MSEDTEIIVTDMSIDEIFLAMQPDEKSREEARQWIKDNPVDYTRPADAGQ